MYKRQTSDRRFLVVINTEVEHLVGLLGVTHWMPMPSFDETLDANRDVLCLLYTSHKRHDRVFATKLVHDPIICVAESQADLYQQFNPECEIVTHPDDVKMCIRDSLSFVLNV